MQEWSVYVSPTIIGWCRATSNTNKQYFDDVVEAVDSIWDVANTYTKAKIVVCQLGFLIPLEKHDSYIECFTYQEKKQIHAVRIVQK